MVLDVRGSRNDNDRADLQHRLLRFVEAQPDSQVRPSLSAGDEIEILSSSNDQVGWRLAAFRAIVQANATVGLGGGDLATAIMSEAAHTDGPVWHRARSGLERAKSQQSGSAIAVGFGDERDSALTGLLSMMTRHVQRCTVKQAEALMVAMTDGDNYHSLGIGQRAYFKHLQAAAAKDYAAASAAVDRLISAWRSEAEE